MLPTRGGNIGCPLRSLGMKTTKLLSLTITALLALSQPIWAQGGFRGGGAGHVGGGGFGGAHLGGGFRGGNFGGYSAGGFRGAPHGFGGAHFASRSFGRSGTVASFYPGRAATPAMRARGFTTPASRSDAGRPATTRLQNRAGSLARQNARASNSRMSTAAAQRAIANHKVFARHDGNWHRDWDRHRAHFDHGHVFVFVDGFWWGLYPWDYYPYYGYDYYPYDYSYDYPYDYSGYPYDGADYSSSQTYSYYNGYAPSGQYSNTVVSAVQSKLASLGYYHGAIDGMLGDESEAALARYQQDQDLSVTGTVTAATLRALGLPYSAGS
jgi:Putative peptidoglycan binding domain